MIAAAKAAARGGFGRRLRPLWSLEDDAIFLNHGSYGAVPRAVAAAHTAFRDRIEQQPDRFIENEVVPADRVTTIRAAAQRLGAFAGMGARCAFVENASGGIEAVLRAAPLTPGARILVTDQQYNAVRVAVERRCAETGAEPLVVPLGFPTRADDIVARIEAAARGGAALAIVDHIASASALLMPVASIVAVLRARGIPVLVDGAHAVGQVDLDVGAIGADWYVTNAHKWLFAPRGTALLHCAKSAPFEPLPPVTSHFFALGFPHAFDYVGTRDYSGWAASPSATEFFEALGPAALRAHGAQLIDSGSAMMANIGARPIGSRDMAATMRSFVLPQRRAATFEDARTLRNMLWEQERIQAYCALFLGRLVVRLSASAYVGESDVAQLVDALVRRGWPGR